MLPPVVIRAGFVIPIVRLIVVMVELLGILLMGAVDIHRVIDLDLLIRLEAFR